ncbi:uncharacterized protein B0T15DRAFT_265237 [Chaetomium strumarium]|uniref:Mid2 domain-containing protein n=1 Tax=Chaetomium strumarium TaxID=1170767 RepID=A0AAJ0GNG1_9PEZI|nr:hypothetical protein B0T15DRAFT_265237 [Chaetomium strumarium]
MKPARTLLSLLTVAAAGAGVAASAQFITTKTTEAAVDARRSDPAKLDARQENVETVRRTITLTSGQNSRPSAKPQPSSSSRKPDDDEEDDEDTSTQDVKTTQSVADSQSTSSTADDKTRLTVPTSTSASSASETSLPRPDGGNGKKGGLSAGTAAGIAAGAVAGIAIIAAIAFLLWRRSQGGIRGAVVTAEYPRSMADMPPPPGQDMEGAATGVGRDGPFYLGIGNGGTYAERSSSAGGGGGGGSGEALFRIPPAGTMPGQPGFEQSDYFQSPQQRQQLEGGDLGEQRPVSEFTTYPSPGQPVLPVSPMTPYRPDSIPAGQLQGQETQSRASVSYPGFGSPELPTYMIPGGDRSRAMSFSSLSRISFGGPHTAELVGSPPPPIPSTAVVEGQPSTRRNQVLD